MLLPSFTHVTQSLIFYLSLAALLVSSQSASANCPTHQKNKLIIEEEIANTKERALDELRRCNTSTMGTARSSVPYRRDLDDAGNILHYIGITNTSGEILRWEQSDKDPNSSDPHFGENHDCEFDEGKYEAEMNALRSMLNVVDQIPCGKLLTDVHCYARQASSSVPYLVECQIQTTNTIPNSSDQNAPNADGRGRSLDQFYSALETAQKRRALEEQSLVSIDETQKSHEQDGTSGRIVTSTEIPNTQLDQVRMSELVGEHAIDIDGGAIVIVNNEGGESPTVIYHDDDGDDKPDWIEVQKQDETATLFIDSDGDGFVDKRTEIGTDGSTSYFDTGAKGAGPTTKSNAERPLVPWYGLTPNPILSDPEDFQLDVKNLELVHEDGTRIDISDQLMEIDYDDLENLGFVPVHGNHNGTPITVPLSKSDVRQALQEAAGLYLIDDSESFSSSLQQVLGDDLAGVNHVRIEGARVESGVSLNSENTANWDRYINDALEGELKDYSLGDKGTVSIYGLREPQSLWAAYGSTIVKGGGQDAPADPYFSDEASKSYVPEQYWKNFQNPYSTNQSRAAALDLGISTVGTALEMYSYMQDDISLVVLRTKNESVTTYRVFERYQDPRPGQPKWTRWYYVSESRAVYVLGGFNEEKR